MSVTIVNLNGIANVTVCAGRTVNGTQIPVRCVPIPPLRETTTISTLLADSLVAVLHITGTTIISNIITNPLSGSCYSISFVNGTLSLDKTTQCTIPVIPPAPCATGCCRTLYSRYDYIPNKVTRSEHHRHKKSRRHHKKHRSHHHKDESSRRRRYECPRCHLRASRCHCDVGCGSGKCGTLYNRYDYIPNHVTRRQH